MKAILFLLICIIMAGQARAGKEKSPAHKETNGVMKIFLLNHITSPLRADSVLVILDKYDRTGAGFVRKIFYPGTDHSIDICNIPEGKYYLTIQCLGLHHDYVEKILRVAKQKTFSMNITLEDSEEYSKEKVIIPPSQNDFSRTSVLRNK